MSLFHCEKKERTFGPPLAWNHHLEGAVYLCVLGGPVTPARGRRVWVVLEPYLEDALEAEAEEDTDLA